MSFRAQSAHWWIGTAATVSAAALSPSPALAHAGERVFMALLPTGYYAAGGAAAVAASFVVLALVPPRAVERLAAARLRLGSVPAVSPVPTSLAAFVLLVILLLAGLFGSRDPLANPLPTMIWTVWWVGVTLLHAILGNVWIYINPWTGPYTLLDRALGGRLSRAPLSYPDRLGYWPAIIVFFGFAWLELVHPAPDDPERLAVAVGLYWLIAFAGMAAFGRQAWTERAEPFSIFFRLIAGLAPLLVEASRHGRWAVSLAMPGAAIMARAALPLSGVVFVLLTLSAVSFDGLSATFWWLALGDINPLEFPGRTEVMVRNTLGLLATTAVLGLGFAAAILLGWRLALRAGSSRTESGRTESGRTESARTESVAPGLGTFIYAIIPISIAFHLSHYLPVLLVETQYAAIALSDPFATGQDVLGLSGTHAITSFMSTYEGTRTIWNVQTGAIVAGHIVAIALAHALAVRHFGDTRRAVVSQLPLAALMVAYTVFGLWLLSTPVGA